MFVHDVTGALVCATLAPIGDRADTSHAADASSTDDADATLTSAPTQATVCVRARVRACYVACVRMSFADVVCAQVSELTTQLRGLLDDLQVCVCTCVCRCVV
jgi:hypothetical protein